MGEPVSNRLRLPEEAPQEHGFNVGDTLYLLENTLVPLVGSRSVRVYEFLIALMSWSIFSATSNVWAGQLRQ